MGKVNKGTPLAIIEAGGKSHKSKTETEARKRMEERLIFGTDELQDVPSSLSDNAKKYWVKIVKRYENMDYPLLNNGSVEFLKIYCEALDLYDEASKQVRKNKKNEENYGKTDPAKLEMEKYAMVVKRYGELLMLDAGSLAKLGIVAGKKAVEKKEENKKQEDPMWKLLNNG